MGQFLLVAKIDPELGSQTHACASRAEKPEAAVDERPGWLRDSGLAQEAGL